MADPQTLDQAVAQMRAAASRFMDAYNVLMADADAAAQDPATAQKWQSLKDYADNVMGTISYINQAYDAAAGAASAVIGMAGVKTLGVLPLLTVAYVIAAIAALVWVTGEIYKFHATLTATPQEISNLQQGGLTTSALGTPSTIGMWLALGALAVFVLPKALEHFEKGKHHAD